ncbi:type VI secretion system protein TssA [uncultured Thiodictyon sp.]|uniref:type VI secretion system protein TssA n=1 Tax=uncultured Thiodictyon sp. TaxID=1846217 RepID=UPI0025F7BCD3|nr:type VI secretion system protein TssA [uncultured Thiodictyon sp.]
MIDTASMLKAVSEDQPTGADLEYDPDFRALVEAATGTPERQMGDSVVPAQEPDWRRVMESSTALFGRSKDLRVAVLLTRALLGQQGLPGLQAGLELIHGLIVEFWDGLHPELDASDDNDPTARVNVLLELTDRDTLLAQLRTTPLIRSRVFGPVSCREVEVAEGKAQPAAGTQPLDAAGIAGAFQDCELESLVAATAAAQAALVALRAIGDDLAARIDRSQLPSFDPLSEPLKHIHTLLQGHLRPRQPEGSDAAATDADDTPAPATGGAAATPARDAGQIASREDVVRTLGRICDYYSRYEPSSPVPLLLKRAQRLVTGSFVDILRDLAPDALSQAEKVFGTTEKS